MSDRSSGLLDPVESPGSRRCPEARIPRSWVPPSGEEPNLLHLGWVSRLLRSRFYPGVFQGVGVAVFAVVMFTTLAGPTAFDENVGATIVWILWWPLLPILFFLFARLWCGVCPFPVIGEWFQKLTGLSLPVPIWLRKYGIWIIDAIFLAITWADHVFGIVASPRGTGYLLLAVLGGIIVTSLFLERRAFCAHLCFLGGLAGNYSMASPLALRANRENCKARCKESWCAEGSEHAPGCPMFIRPRTIDSNRDCNLCANCIKSCPRGSIRLELRKPTAEFWATRKPRLEVASLAIVLVGVVLVQNLTMLGIYDTILGWTSSVTASASTSVNFSLVFLVAMAAPVALLLATSWVSARLGGGSVRRNFTRFGYALIPLDLAGHIAHNLLHLLGEGLAVPKAVVTQLGRTWTGGTALLSTATIQVLQYAVLGAGVVATVYAAYRIARSGGARTNVRALVPQLAMIAVLVAANVYLFSQPMAHRA
ncbi:MAG: 4Fe-4S binding protein [Acidobacteria bacterium]|nr:4Fe-4S binding protein [Acidobacteriota bacterium]